MHAHVATLYTSVIISTSRKKQAIVEHTEQAIPIERPLVAHEGHAPTSMKHSHQHTVILVAYIVQWPLHLNHPALHLTTAYHARTLNNMGQGQWTGVGSSMG